MRRAIFAIAIVFASGAVALAANKISVSHNSDDEDAVSITHISNGDRGNFWVKSRDLNMAAEWDGEFLFAADGRSLMMLDGELEIERKVGSTKTKVAFVSRRGEIETTYTVGKRKQAIDAAAETEIADLVLAFVRASGIDADERVAAMLQAGGEEAVLSEIEQISVGHSAMRYIVALAEQGDLSAAHIEQLIPEIERLEGDHSKRRAIGALFEEQSLSPASRSALLKAAEGISGDHELRKLLEAVTEGELTADAVETSLILIQRISGDHEFRMSAEALLENASFPDGAAVRLLALAGDHVGGDHDLRNVVETAAMRIRKSDAVAGAAIKALGEIGSDHDRRNAIEAVADELPKSSPRWIALIEAAGAIGSDHDAANALEAIADLMPADNAHVAAYRAAAESIGSSHDRENALDALAER